MPEQVWERWTKDLKHGLTSEQREELHLLRDCTHAPPADPASGLPQDALSVNNGFTIEIYGFLHTFTYLLARAAPDAIARRRRAWTEEENRRRRQNESRCMEDGQGGTVPWFFEVHKPGNPC